MMLTSRSHAPGGAAGSAGGASFCSRLATPPTSAPCGVPARWRLPPSRAEGGLGRFTSLESSPSPAESRAHFLAPRRRALTTRAAPLLTRPRRAVLRFERKRTRRETFARVDRVTQHPVPRRTLPDPALGARASVPGSRGDVRLIEMRQAHRAAIRWSSSRPSGGACSPRAVAIGSPQGRRPSPARRACRPRRGNPRRRSRRVSTAAARSRDSSTVLAGPSPPGSPVRSARAHRVHCSIPLLLPPLPIEDRFDATLGSSSGGIARVNG